MKRKLFLAVIMVLVLCLTCGMLLVACDKDDPVEPTPPPATDEPITVTSADVWPEVQAYLQANNEYALALEIKAKDENGNPTGNPIFGLAFEKIGDEYVMYGNVGSNSYIKLKGFDIIGLIDKIDSLVGTFDIGDLLKGQSVKSLLEMVGAMIWAEDALLYNNNVYDFTFDISGILDLIGPILAEIENIDATVAGFIGVTVEELGNTVKTVADVIGLDYDSTNGIVNGLIDAIATLVNTHDISIVIGTGEAVTNDANNPFGGVITGINADLRESAAQNLLNVTLDGTAQLTTGETVDGDYTIDVDIDINPFELLAIVDALEKNEDGSMAVNMSSDEIVDMLTKLGYINVTVDEVGEDGSLVRNILTIHSNFEEGRVIAQLYGESIIIYDVAVGGVFEFDALVGFISDLTSGAITQAEGDETTTEEPSVIDTILGYAEGVLALTNFNVFEEGFDFNTAAAEVAANGLVIDMTGIMDFIDTITDVDADIALGFTLRDLLPDLWKDSETMTIKVQSVGFGNAVRKDTAEISAMQSSPSEALVSEITGIEGLPTAVVDDAGIPVGMDNAYTMTGTSIATGETVEFEGYILGYSGLDITQTGEQQVTFYVAAANSGSGLIGMLTGMIDLTGYPVFGVYEYTATIELLAGDPDAEVTTENIVSGTYIPVATNSTIWSNIATDDNAYLVINDVAKTAVTADNVFLYTEDGTLIEKTNTEYFDENGNIIKEGRYEVRIVKNSFTYSFDIQAMEITNATTATIVTKDGAAAPTEWELGTTVTYEGYTLKIGDYVFDMDPTTMPDIASKSESVDGNNYTLNKDLANSGSTLRFSWSLKRSDATYTKSFSHSIKLTAPYEVDKEYSVYFGASANGAVTITYNDTEYSLSYDAASGQWVAKDAAGNLLADFSATVEWDSVGSGLTVTVNEDGWITNNSNEYKNSTRSRRFYVSFSIGDWTYSTNVSAYELYASDKTSSYSALEVGETLDGFISYVNYITDETGERAGYTFKYGAEGYGIYKDDTLICAVTVTIYNGETDVTSGVMADGAFTAAGTYKVDYNFTINGINQHFFHNVLVNAAEA